MITNSEKKEYLNEFEKLDKEKKGIITGNEVKPFFFKFGIPKKQLALIW